MKENKINIFNSTVSFFNKLIEFNPRIFDGTRAVLIGGETVLPKTVNILRNINHNVDVINVYGPTENSDLSACHIINKNYEKSVPIGIPVANSTCYILDKNQKLLPINTPGEIYVGGDGVAIEYLNRPELTKEKFISNPFGTGKLYKTGDLGYFEENGNLQFLSRIDSQVKIRGFRIELKEIETKILEYGNIKECAVITMENNSSVYLTACIVSKDKINIQELNSYLKSKLPHYMVPLKYILMDNLPLNINGKLDVKLIKKTMSTSETDNNIVPSRNNVDKKIINILSDVLSVSDIGINESFFEIGGDSLSAISFSGRLSKEFENLITVQDIFNFPVIKDLSDYIATLTKESVLSSISIAEKTDFYPLSSAQKRIYYSCNLDKNSVLYNVSGGIIIDKLLDFKKLQNCFEELIKRHDALRTHFDINGDDIVQIIDDDVDFKLELENTDSNDTNKIYKDFVNPFDLSKAPLFRAKAINFKNKETFLLLDMHHIISDGASLSILLQELCDLYNGKSLLEKRIDYKDFSIWEQEQFKTEKFNESKEYWLNQLSGNLPVLNMPLKAPRPSVQSFEGSSYYSQLPKEIFIKINEISRQLNVTPYMLLLSCFYILLSKYTSQEDIILGTPVVGRELPELSNVLGMFVNTLALRNSVNSNLSFEEFIKNIKENTINAFKNQEYPFDMLVKDLQITRNTSRNPLFDIMFVYQSNGFPKVNFSDATVKYLLPDNDISKFDLSLEIIPTDEEYSMRFEYCTKLFDNTFIKKLSAHYINILTSVLENQEIKILDIEMMSDDEKNQILFDFNNTKADFPEDKTIIDLFEEQVRKTPNDTAIVFDDKAITYKELNEKANKIANYLISKKIVPDSCIGILMPKSLDTIVLMLAILKINCSYVLIDNSLPSSRIYYMLDNSNASLLITSKFNELIVFENKLFIENIKYEEYSKNNINLPSDPNRIISVLYTSGSTGKPKGILLHNKGFVNIVWEHILQMDINSCNTFLSYSSVSFDMFQVEIFVPLLTGSKIILTTEEQQKSPVQLSSLISNEKIDFIVSTPSKISLIFEAEDKTFPNLKVIQLGGEKLSSKTVDLISSFSPNATIYNAYGPSEITAFCSCKKINLSEPVTIGSPICNMGILILDSNNKLLPIGIPGEICVFGVGLSNGYINQDDLTQKSFVKLDWFDSTIYKTGDIGFWNDSGNIVYIDRKDNQIKLRGLRIELSEIQNALLKHPDIRDCYILVKNNEYLSAFVTSEKNLDVKDIKLYLKESLPLYMIPRYITQIRTLPINTNGKVDTNILSIYKENNESSSYVAPTTEKEKIFCNILEELLNTRVGIYDDIFELGTDSLLAIRFKTLLLKYNYDIEYADIFKYPHIHDLCQEAKIIEQSDDLSNYDYSNINNILVKNDNKFCTSFITSTNNNILLLGANGFVGMHVINSFIQNDSGKIFCLVRSQNNISAQKRFMDTLHFYFGNDLDKYINTRIFIINGNVLKEDFALSKENLDNLNKNISIVIDSAATVKHYGKSEDFNDINIGSAKAVINYCLNYNKKLLYISSLSVSGNDTLEGNQSTQNLSCYFSEKDLYLGQQINNLYVKSKFIAERLILQNIFDNNLNAKIFRLGNITSRFSDGKFQINFTKNAFANKLKSLISLHSIPKSMLDSYVEFTPVDYCANAIIKLMQNNFYPATVFHIYNPNHVDMSNLLSMINRAGTRIKVISNNRFSKLVEKHIKNNPDSISGIINDFNNDKLLYKSNIRITSNFSANCFDLINFSWPVISQEYIEKYLKYFYDINFLEE